MNRTNLAVIVIVIIVVAAVGGTALLTNLIMPTSSTTNGLTSTTSTGVGSNTQSLTTSTTSTSSCVGQNCYDFLIFTQKGIAELASPSGSMLGYQRLFNISDSVPAQVFYWDAYPLPGVRTPILGLPLNNGTVKLVNTTSMKVIDTLNLGGLLGFIGVAPNPNQTLAAIADGPSGIVEVLNLNTLHVVWNQTFAIPGTGKTAYPCDIRWTPDGKGLVVPMKNNNSIVTLNGANGAITASAVLPKGTGPYMLSVNQGGSMVAVELSQNKTDVFYSLPRLSPVGHVILNSTNFGAQRGLFTPDGKYYLEASGSSNVIDVISLSSFQVVNTITLTASSSPGLSDMELTPDSNYLYVVQHGTPATGGIIYLIPLSNIASNSVAPASSIALTTAPAIAIPISAQTGNYLANNVLSPPVTGLHC